MTSQVQILERDGGLVYKEVGDAVRLVMKYGETDTVIEVKGNVLRAYRRNSEEVEDLITVRLKQHVAAKLRKYMRNVSSPIEISLLWFELERATVYLSPRGADIKFWKLNLDEPDKRQKKSITHILSRLKLFFLKPFSPPS
jgi:hypothetical protein